VPGFVPHIGICISSSMIRVKIVPVSHSLPAVIFHGAVDAPPINVALLNDACGNSVASSLPPYRSIVRSMTKFCNWLNAEFFCLRHVDVSHPDGFGV